MLRVPVTEKLACNSYARQTDRKPMMNGLLYAGTGVPRPLILNPRMNEFPVPIERLKREFGQPVVENECPQPEAEDHRLHDVLWNRHDSAELKCELYVLESESHLAFCIAFGRGRLPEPGLWDSTRAPTSSVATSPVFENSKMSAGLTFALRNNATISLLNSRRSDSVIGPGIPVNETIPLPELWMGRSHFCSF
jgi:hypothetical protein